MVVWKPIFSSLALVILRLLCFQIFFFLALPCGSGFGAAISDGHAVSFIVVRDSFSAGCDVIAASRLLGAAACVILLSFAARHGKS